MDDNNTPEVETLAPAPVPAVEVSGVQSSGVDPIEALVKGAVGSGSTPAETQAAIDSLDPAREAVAVPVEPTKAVPVMEPAKLSKPSTSTATQSGTHKPLTASVQTPKPVVLTKTVLQKELDAAKARLVVLEAQGNTKAISDLGATVAVALQIAGRFMAAKRGPHWVFDKDESANLGEAWANCMAPYAEQIKAGVPWALAIALTWKAMEPRLEADKLLAKDKPAKPSRCECEAHQGDHSLCDGSGCECKASDG